MSYEIELAREIIAQKETKATGSIPIISTDNAFLKYKDAYIKVIVGNESVTCRNLPPANNSE